VAEFFEMPQASPTMEVGTVLSWKKAEGDSLSPQDVLAEVETDKAAMEIEVFDSGVLLKILADEGDQVPAGQPIAILGSSADEDISDLLAQFEKIKANAAAPSAPAADTPTSAAPAAPAASTTPSTAAPTETGLTPFSWAGKTIDSSIMEMPTFTVALPSVTPGSAPLPAGKVRSSPAARAAARSQGINLGTVIGTGPRGRVTRADVLRHAAGVAPVVAAPAAPAPRAVPLPTPNEGDEVVPNTNMRKTIAKRLKAAYSDAPVFFLTRQFDCDALVEYRAGLKADGKRISYNDIVLAACGRALRDVPDVNAAWAEDSIIKRAAVDIGMAVALPGGLITPVIRGADSRSLEDIAADTRALATKAKDGKLAPNEYTGSTFTISNLGMKGIEQFTAIINPPEACILAVGAMAQVPVVVDGAVTAGWRMKVTLTCDHRVVDGALGADFLEAVRGYIEDPSRLD
jgi:pyruvate dehydrogenase E2 component (dihydrolipoamide acetyltransferase)